MDMFARSTSSTGRLASALDRKTGPMLIGVVEVVVLGVPFVGVVVEDEPTG